MMIAKMLVKIDNITKLFFYETRCCGQYDRRHLLKTTDKCKDAALKEPKEEEIPSLS